MRSFMVRIGVGFTALFVMAFTLSAARADTLRIHNKSGATISVLEGEGPFTAAAYGLAPGETQSIDVWRIAPDRLITVINEDTGDTVFQDQRKIPFGIRSLTVTDNPRKIQLSS